VEPQVLVEVFSGDVILVAALRRHGHFVTEWDIKWGAAWDLTRPSNSRLLRGWVMSGKVWGLHFGVPCESWTRARDRGPPRMPGKLAGWPSRLRSDEEIWGLAAVMHPPDGAVINVGNQLALITLSVMRAAKHMQLPFIVENPATSRLWLIPQMQRAQRWDHASFDTTLYYMDGKPWKKPTSILAYRVDLSTVVRQCHGVSRMCQRSQKPHQLLTGKSPSGMLWTRVAQPYKQKLVTRWAAALEAGAMNTRALKESRWWLA